MPDFAYIVRNLYGAWLALLGRPQGLALLDISERGFWRSFWAIAVASPALFLVWLSYGRELCALIPVSVETIMLKSAFVDFFSWLSPFAVFAALAKPLKISHRFVHYVVATNWASVIISYAIVLLLLVDYLGPDFESARIIVSLTFFVGSLILLFLLTHLTVGADYQASALVFVATIIVSLIVVYGGQSLLGIAYPASSPG
jgi:hypothetical protein